MLVLHFLKNLLVVASMDTSNNSDNENLLCNGCDSEVADCGCQNIMKTFHHLNELWYDYLI